MQRIQEDMRRLERAFFEGEPSRFSRGPFSLLRGWEQEKHSHDEMAVDHVADKDGNKKILLRFNVRGYTPEEIDVKAFGNRITVRAKHEEKSDSGAVYREFTREYTLPDGVNLAALKSSLTEHGELKVEAPFLAIEPPKETEIPIMKEEATKEEPKK